MCVSRLVTGLLGLSFLFSASAKGREPVRNRESGRLLQADQRHLALSTVKNKPARAEAFTVSNPLDRSLPAGLSITGKDADAFTAEASAAEVSAGGSLEVTVRFQPVRGAGRYSASVQIGTPEEGTFVVLQGIGLAAFEGKNEPPLQSIVHALGISLDVGGTRLELDTQVATIGESVAVPYFRKAGAGTVRVTPLARFSPPGATPFGIVAKETTDLIEVGKLAASDPVADAHQSLHPPVEGDVTEFEPQAEAFAFYMQGHKYVSFTDPALPTKATIPHTARVYPVMQYLGRPMRHAWLVGFEEAANGDYQDAVFLLENVEPAP